MRHILMRSRARPVLVLAHPLGGHRGERQAILRGGRLHLRHLDLRVRHALLLVLRHAEVAELPRGMGRGGVDQEVLRSLTVRALGGQEVLRSRTGARRAVREGGHHGQRRGGRPGAGRHHAHDLAAGAEDVHPLRAGHRVGHMLHLLHRGHLVSALPRDRDHYLAGRHLGREGRGERLRLLRDRRARVAGAVLGRALQQGFRRAPRGLLHVAAAHGALHLESLAVAQHEVAREASAQQRVHGARVVEDDEAEAAVVVGVVRGGGPRAVLLEPGLLHARALGEDGEELVLGHVLGNASHEDLPALRRDARRALGALLDPLVRAPLGARRDDGLLRQRRAPAAVGARRGAPRGGGGRRPRGGGRAGAHRAGRAAAVGGALHVEAPRGLAVGVGAAEDLPELVVGLVRERRLLGVVHGSSEAVHGSVDRCQVGPTGLGAGRD
mmetsp:Transcript_65613/g.171920  ORF Transcript_65613/g.171920 Transcript_65613/m.171920 type:complete len:439 (-) Transcript_65613:213-1529(-)